MGKTEIYNVVLIRCGETEWDRAHRIVGRVDLPLAPASADGLTGSVGSLDGTQLSAVLHGPDQCLIATAEAVSRVTGGKLKRVPELMDVGMGLWEGLRTQELEEKFPSAYRQWRERPASVSVPEGEPMREATDRLIGALGRALDKLRHPDPGVGVVLRPMSFSLVLAWLTGEDVSAVTVPEGGAAHEWCEVSRARLREAREGAGVGG